MSRQVNQQERIIFDIVQDYNHRFYYESISMAIEEEGFKIKIEKPKEEMVGRAFVTLAEGNKWEYEIRYNRLINLTEGYTVFIPCAKTG